MRSPRRPIEDLRLAIDCLPTRTRTAMLEGIRSEDIVVGAYTMRGGGICPMLAAHRRGGRTDFISFARAWDRFTGATRRARHATGRELRILESHLEASLLSDDDVDFERAIVEHRASVARGDRGQRPGDPDRAAELRDRPGWRWLRPFRRLDDYERALARVHAEAERDEREPAAVT
jgi:hypothetical protein